MTTAAVLGAGDLGGAIAHALARRQSVERVLIVDAASAPAAGKALDIQQSGAVEGFHTRLEATDDASRVIGCSVCLVADRFFSAGASAKADGSPSSEWQGDEGVAQLVRVQPFIGNAVVVLAGAAHGPMLLNAVREGRWPRARIVGSAPEALAAAVRAIVAVEARCSSSEVMLTVLGAPPAGFVIPWSEASIGGYALERVLTPVQLTRIEARAVRLWPPGPQALGLAAATVAEAVIRSSRRAFAVSAVLHGELGVKDRVSALPVLLGPAGIVETRTPSLSTRERVLLDSALGV